ncbi:MAG: MCE family protein [Deltaproteobacteria bacterium]|nr:MCE family protein [Deltaproteobacteria bacterium]
MSRRASPTLIGAFVLGAVILAVVTVLLVAGGQVFQERPRHVIYFEGAAQGLQIGAPVLFLGVKVGTVKQIQLGLDERNDRFTVLVTVEVEPNVARSRAGKAIDLGKRVTLKCLVERGLRAQLRIQSLLTGQLYVDLDFHPDKPAVFVAIDPDVSEIPSIPTPVQEFTARIENVPWDRFIAQVSAIGDALDKLLADPATSEIPRRLETALTHLDLLVSKLDAETQPTMAALRDDLTELQATLLVAQAALNRLGAAADQVNMLASPEAPVAAGLTRAAEELSNAARTVGAVAGEESPSVVHLNAALQEMTKAARSLRVLAETLEQRPESLLQGKKAMEERP